MPAASLRGRRGSHTPPDAPSQPFSPLRNSPVSVSHQHSPIAQQGGPRARGYPGLEKRAWSTGRAARRPPEPKARNRGHPGARVRARHPRVTARPLPAQREDVAAVWIAQGPGPGLSAIPRVSSLRWERRRLLHAGPEPGAPDAGVLLLRGSSGPGWPGAGPTRVGLGQRLGVPERAGPDGGARDGAGL